MPIRRLLPPLVLLLAGCDATASSLGLGAAAVNIGVVPVLHRDLFDVAYSAITGRDCSAVRLDRGQTYCRPLEPLPAPPVYCTRSLANVDCWSDPSAAPWFPPPVADGPRQLTPAQEADRTRTWPGLGL
jgi:hypothetical protein